MDKVKRDAAPEAAQTDTEREEQITRETWADAEEAGAERDGDGDALILRFNRPYVFEGQEYTELDLTGLENASAATLSSVGRVLAKTAPGLNAASVEMTLDYAKALAQRITKKPVEFFDRLPAKEAMKLKGIVVGFLFGGDGDN